MMEDLDPNKKITEKDPAGPKNIRILRIRIHHPGYNSVWIKYSADPQKDTLDSYLYPLGDAHLILNHLGGSPVYLGMHICG